MCVHIKLSIFENIFSKIEKAVITFSILEKIFPKTKNLMCALRAHISKILFLIDFAVLFRVMLETLILTQFCVIIRHMSSYN